MINYNLLLNEVYYMDLENEPIENIISMVKKDYNLIVNEEDIKFMVRLVDLSVPNE